MLIRSSHPLFNSLTRYPANETGYPAGYRIAKRPDIRPDIRYNPKYLYPGRGDGCLRRYVEEGGQEEGPADPLRPQTRTLGQDQVRVVVVNQCSISNAMIIGDIEALL